VEEYVRIILFREMSLSEAVEAVNGQPLPAPPIGAPAAWLPDGPGFVKISVTDHFQRTATTEIWVE